MLADEDTRAAKLAKAKACSQTLDRLRTSHAAEPTHDKLVQMQRLERDRKFLIGSMPLTLAYERKPDGE